MHGYRSFRFRIFFSWVCSFLFCILVVPCRGAETESPLKKGLSESSFMGSGEEAWKIEAFRIIYDNRSKQYIAEGSVRISSEDRLIQADWALLDTTQKVAELKGNVLLRYEQDWLEGDHVIWNLEKETGWVNEGLVFFARNHFYVSGKNISKTGPTEYELKEGFLTTCDPANADWSVRYREMKVNTEGIAWARGSSFRVRKLPLLYVPVVAIPISRERQSGFLAPKFALSDLNGFEVEVPFFWNIRRDMDATFYGHYFHKRGFMSGLEYRINNETWGEGIWMANYLSDRAGKTDLREYDYPFEQEDRYWIRARHSFELPYEVQGRLNLDVASDRNFLKEFETGSVSYDHTDNMFRKFFGRGVLNDKTILARESNLYLSKKGEDALLGMDVHYWDNLDRDVDEFTLQQLPKLTFDIAPDLIGKLPLYYSLNSSYVNYWRREGDRGNRLDLYPRAYYPLHWGSYLDVEPSMGTRFTSYQVDWEESDRSQWQGRIIPDVQLAMSSRLNRVYSIGGKDGFSLQHAVRPEIVYEYIDKVDQDDIPKFDASDEIVPRHDIRYGVSSFFTSKRVVKNAEGVSTTHYRELARLRVSQAYNIRTEPLPESLTESDSGEDFPTGSDFAWDAFNIENRFSDVRFELDITPDRYLYLSYDVDISPYESSATRHELYMNLDSGLGHSLGVSYRFHRDSVIEELISNLKLNIFSNVSFVAYHDYSFDRKEMFKQGYGMNYQRGCWGIRLGYDKEAEDQRVTLSFDLLGLGSIGGGYSIGDSIDDSVDDQDSLSQ